MIRLRVQLLEGDEVVHEYTRSTTNPDGITTMLGECMGWMQAYQGAVNARQWANDVARVRQARAQLEATLESAG